MGMIMRNGKPYAQGSEIPQGGTKGQVLAKASNLDGDMEWKDEEGGGTGGGNADFDIATIPLGGSGTYEVNALLSNGDNESVRALYSRGANGEIPEWFSMNVTSGLGTDTFHVATKELVDKAANWYHINAMSGNLPTKTDFIDNMRMRPCSIWMNGRNHIITGYKDESSEYTLFVYAIYHTFSGIFECEFQFTYDGETVTYSSVSEQKVATTAYADGKAGTNLEVGVEKWCGTYKENGVTYQVYNKIIKIDALPAEAGQVGYPHGITGIKQILQAYGFTGDGFVMNAPRQTAADNIAIYQVQKSGNIMIEVGKDRSAKTAYVCLVYAKNN